MTDMTGILAISVALAGGLLTQQSPTAAYVAESPPIGTACAQDDLVGVWSSDRLGRAVDANTAPPTLSTDYMRISADGAMAYFASPRKPDGLGEIERGLDVIQQAGGPNFTALIVQAGVLIIARDGTPVEGFTCTMIRNTDEAGELIWTQLRGRPPVLRHNLRLGR